MSSNLWGYVSGTTEGGKSNRLHRRSFDIITRSLQVQGGEKKKKKG